MVVVLETKGEQCRLSVFIETEKTILLCDRATGRERVELSFNAGEFAEVCDLTHGWSGWL